MGHNRRMGKLSFLAGAAAGYVLGSRAGRQRYEQIRAVSAKAMGTPQAQKVKDAAKTQATHLAEGAKAKAGTTASDAVSAMSAKVSSAVSDRRAKAGGRSDTLTASGTNGASPVSVTGDAGEQSSAPGTGSGYSI